MDGVDNHLFKLNMTTLKWTQYESNEKVPSLYSCNIQKYKNFIYVIAGANNTHYNTSYGGLYRFDLDNEKWENLYQKDFDNKVSRETYKTRDLAGSLLFGDILFLISGMGVENNKNLGEFLFVNLTDPILNWTKFLDIADGGRDSFAFTQVDTVMYGFAGFIGVNKNLSNQLSILNLATQKLSAGSEEYPAPESRSFHSMSLVNGKFYVFGGINGNKYLNDVWVFDPAKGSWTTINTIGTIPSGRYAFATASQGDAIAVWGGSDFIGLKNDLYIFKVFSSTWELLVPTTADMPTAAKGACLALNIPQIFIYGGETTSGLSNTLYEFNILTNSYTRLKDDNYVAYAVCEIKDSVFYVIFGRTFNTLVSRQVRAYSIETDAWTDHLTLPSDHFLTSQGVTLFMDGNVVVIGGQLWDVYPYNSVYFYSPQEHALLGYISEYPYRAASVYYQNSFYIFGGGDVIGQSLRSGVSTNNMYSVSIGEICAGSKCPIICSKGTMSQDGLCTVCRKGTYSEGVDNSTCSLCESGTYNPFIGSTSRRQCYPCGKDTYNEFEGKGFCVDCLNGFTCPPGSVFPVDTLRTVTSGSLQPKLFERPDISRKVFDFEISVGMIMGFIFVFIVCFESSRAKLAKIDTYTNLHNYVIGQVMHLRATFIGGAATWLFLCTAIVIIGSTFISYSDDNVQESKTLVPKVVLDQEVEEFVAKDFLFVVEFMRYGDVCEELEFTKKNIEGLDERFNYTKDRNDKTCHLELSYKDLIISSGASITIISNEKFSYCSGIMVNLTSSSSIPSEISSISMNLSPEGNKVFVGPTPSNFFFTITPSLFKSDSSEWPSKSTGYHISSENVPVAGSQFLTSELSIISQLKLVIELKVSNSGLYTYRYYEQTFIYVASALIGSIFGIMGAVGGIMKVIEKNYWRLKNIYRKKVNINEVDRHRNYVEKQFETQVEGREDDNEDLGKTWRIDIEF